MNGATIFIILWVTGAIFILTSSYKRGKKALSIFPDIKSVSVVYRDKSASGRSNKSWETRMGAAVKVLDIVVTEDELWLKSKILFAGFGKRFDLLHKVPLNNIIAAQKQGRTVIVDFRIEGGEHTQVEIRTKYPEDFLKAIKK